MNPPNPGMAHSTQLLSAETGHPLKRLSMERIRFDRNHATLTVPCNHDEILLYSLVGTIAVNVGEPRQSGTDVRYIDVGHVGERANILDRSNAGVRIQSGSEAYLALELVGHAADCLVVRCHPEMNTAIPLVHPYVHKNDAVWHSVGEGTHHRIVAEVPMPEGYAIECGETLNDIGAWSSWPPHATADDMEKFSNGETSWEEAFFVVCAKPGIAMLNGVYADGTIVNKAQVLENGGAYVMPLGSHACVAAPDSFLWYAWFFCGTALKKQYNKWSTDVNTYVK